MVHYDEGGAGAESAVAGAWQCRQTLRYRCWGGARLAAGWWEGGQSSLPRPYTCSPEPCNCDGRPDPAEDWLVITDLAALPVTRLTFGDTGTPLDSKRARGAVANILFS